MALVKAGDHLRSRVCTTEVIVVRAPGVDTTICCGGEPMVGKNETIGAPTSTAVESPGTLLGKRYADDGRGLELLCVKGGGGTLTVDGEVLPVRAAKPLPASD